ncbi:hypothetical protein RFI_33014 [Reticulomyxa filosa]|uniref:Viral A-type inclusion protein n=1 Tax=Reticulomyxa filosa TaxID=46433 RepID=X6LSQ7_RETFI|nr:hypothetical protein RFI_33014 [Reticulomyxa filosa]|eukprot:ETO04381.1 hypothetical protein RFI_33014 [Reticulomyxa filosa]
MKQLSLEDESIKDKVFDLTQKLLKYEQKEPGLEQSLEVWIQLFNCKVESNCRLGWTAMRQLLSRKALWLLADSRWNLLPATCHDELEKCLESKAEHFQYQNKCWTDKDRSQLDQYIGKPPWDLTKWNWFLSLFLKYQSEKLCFVFYFSYFIYVHAYKNIILSSIDSDEEKELQNETKKHTLSSAQTDQLLYELKQCISYTGWKDIIRNHRNIEVLIQQWNFMQDTLNTLDNVIKGGKTNFALCKFVKKDSNEKCIKELAGQLLDQQIWTEAMEKFRNFEKWNNVLEQLLAKKYLEKVPSDLEEFHNFFRALNYDWISDVEARMERGMRLLECFHDEWQVMIDRKDTQTFHTMWDFYKGQFQTLQCLKIQFQPDQVDLNPELETQLSRFVKRTSKQNIRRIMTAWRHLAKKAKFMHIQPTTSIISLLQNKYFFLDELAYFPQGFFFWKYCVAAYNFVLSRFDELYKMNDADSTSPTVTIDFIEVFENINLKWEEKTKVFNGNKALEAEITKLQQLQDIWRQLKRGVETIQKYHKGKRDISDGNAWRAVEKALKMSEELLAGKIEVEIEEANNAYKQCTEQFGDIAKYVHILELIVRHERNIKEIATNHVFTNNTSFEYGLQLLKDCDNEKFHRLIEPLCIINQTMQEKIWKARFKDTDELTKAILELIDDNKEWDKNMEACFEVNFHVLIRSMAPSDEAVVIKEFGEFEKANRQGNWVLSDYNSIRTSRSNSDKYEGLTLEFEGTQLNCESMENSIDRLKLGLTSAQQKKIANILLQFEICKDLYAIRMDYWEKGGVANQTSLILQANVSIDLMGGNLGKME